MAAERAVSEAAAVRETLQIFQGILSAIQGVVGEGAAQALLRYGAFEEGKRLASDHGVNDLDSALALVSRIARLEGKATSAPDGVRIEVQACPVLGPRSPVLDTLLLGAIEGALYGAVDRRLRGRVAKREDDGSALLVFETEAS